MFPPLRINLSYFQGFRIFKDGQLPPSKMPF